MSGLISFQHGVYHFYRFSGHATFTLQLSLQLHDAISGRMNHQLKTMIMKRLILSMTMMLAAFLTQASEQVEREKGKQKGQQYENVSRQMEVSQIIPVVLDCSVTLKGKVDLGPIEAEISCTVTDPSCEKAQVAAAACLKHALRLTAGIIM
jgi:hypothetical protein